MSGATAGGARRGLAALALLAALGSCLLLSRHRPPPSRVWGDEGTYLAMTASLARDGDLVFDEGDLRRERREHPPGPNGVILERTGRGICYSKPILYPLLGTPFHRVLGDPGLVLLNGLALVLGLAVALRHLRGREGRAGRAELLVATFAGTGAILPYLAWRMPESLEVGLTLLGLGLALDEPRPRRVGWRGRLAGALLSPPCGAFALGLLGSLRYPNAVLAPVPVAVALLRGKPGRALALAACAAAAFLLVGALSAGLTGAFNPYKAERTGFNDDTGYPVGADAERVLRRFEDSPGTNRLALRPAVDTSLVPYALLYFLVGRHTGLAIYFPLALVLVAASLRRPRRDCLVALGGALALAAFYLVWQPRNYFGGATFVGNRYFLPAYGALLYAVPRLPRGRHLAIPWLVAAVAFGSALRSVRQPGHADPVSQSHAHAGVFRLLPYESIAPDLDGSRDRYWQGELLRFVDPYAEVRENSFVLRTGDPAAELLVASRGTPHDLVFRVRASVPRLEVEVQGLLGSRSFLIEPVPGGSAAVLRVPAEPAWRKHSFWWIPDLPYVARSLRLRLLGPDRKPAVATFVYLGDGTTREPSFAREVERVELPVKGRAGEAGVARIRVRNLGPGAWSSEAPVPIHGSYRLFRQGEEARVAEGERTSLARAVGPGESVELELEIRWPSAPGPYRLVVDLVAEDVAWFEEELGAPLAAGEVEVAAP